MSARIATAMRCLVLVAILVWPIACRAAASTEDSKLFPYPVVPDSKVVLSERCNYLVDHFWDRCNLKQAFSTRQKLSEAFGDWVMLMPYATADTVHMAVDRFIANVKKQPKNLLTIGEIAQRWLYCDSAEYVSEELYYPFAAAVAANKKVPSADRAIFAAHARQLASSKVGDIAPSFRMTTPDGGAVEFADIVAPAIILFFGDPDCSDCRMAKLRLEADYNTKQLMQGGRLKIVSVYPGEPSQDWAQQASEAYSADWVVGASPDVDMLYTMPTTPTLYFLDNNHKILGKNLVIDNVLNAMRVFNSPAQQ